MKTKPVISLLMVALLGLTQASAFAEPGNGNGNNNTSHCGNGRQDCGGNQGGRNQGRGNNDRGPQGYDNHRGPQGYDNERGAGPSHSYYRGDRLPMQYRGRQYVVDDWRGHGLRTPPRGYHWVQSGGDYVLVAIATGVILELLLSR